MIRVIIRTARRLDLWLRDKLGRPYSALLGIGLLIEIGRRLIELPEKVASKPRLIGSLLVLVLDAALLLHQIGEITVHFGPREEPAAPPEEA